MINYFVTGAHAYTVAAFLETWPNRVRDVFRIVPYERLASILTVESGVYIFSDIDRLQPAALRNVERLCDLIADELDAALVLNHPRGVLLRTQMLRTLWEDGVNQFRAFEYESAAKDFRFPIFIRMANDHKGPLGDLIHDDDAYRDALKRVLSARVDTRQLMITEFCDTRGADELYRKYSAFRIGDRIVPGHIIFSTNWITKNSGPEPLREEERAYLADNPHREALLRIFDRAGITYGRIDYGLLSERIQVWEINTNPMVIQERQKYAAEKLALKLRLVDDLSDALLVLNRAAESDQVRRVAVPRGIFQNVGIVPRVRYNRLLRGLRL
jgi:hypothetical protein